MLLAFVSGLGPNRDETDLCLIPDRVEEASPPVRVRDIQPTIAAGHRISNEEFVIAKMEDGDIVIESQSANGIFLTPNLNQMPGFRTKKVKISDAGGVYRTWYSKDKGAWEEWIANRERV